MRKIFVFFLFIFQFGFSQLNDFSLNLTVTHETCQGNGALSFTVQNMNPDAVITYSVYLAPNLTTPVGVTQSSSLSGLSAGSYVVIATQNLNGDSNTAQQQAVINNNINPLTFTISEQNVKCGNDGVLTATVTSGNPVSFELLAGPVTFPPQASNIFTELPIGNYSIRVFDICGNAVVNSFTLIQSYTPINLYWEDERDLTCNTVKLSLATNVSQTNFSSLAFPINLEYIVYPPNNASPLVYNHILTQNNLQGLDQIIPRFNENYSYDIKFTDACGNILERHNIPLNFSPRLTIFTSHGCPNLISLSYLYIKPPFNVEFISFPSGFDPNQSNPQLPGPFYNSSQLYFSVIPGDYTIKITDSCGNSATQIKTVIAYPMPVLDFTTSDGCGLIQLSTYETNNYIFQNVTLISAPSNFNMLLPADLTSHLVNPKKWQMFGFVPGNYVFNIIDNCGNLITKNITLRPVQDASFIATSSVGCEIGKGNINCNYGGYYLNTFNIQSAVITSAPQTFPYSLPHTLTTNSNLSGFSMTNIPEGNYSVQMISTCGREQNNSFIVQGYTETSTNIEIEQFCSSFNLKFQHLGHNLLYYTNSCFYSLQKFDEVNQVWVHPITNQQIVNNQLNTNNIYGLLHNQWNLNLNLSGKFRILKIFSLNDYEYCIKPIKEFEIIGVPKIEGFDILNCVSGNSIVIINAIGNGNLFYKITRKDGQVFNINNGTNNIFINLSPALYDFEIEDSCGNLLTQQIQIFDNIPIQVLPNLCENQLSTLTLPNFTFLQYEWWKDGNPSVILSNSNVLTFNPFNFVSDGGIYYVRITHIGRPDSCLNNVMTYIISNQLDNPQAGLDNVVNFCNSRTTVNLNSYLSGTFSSNGTWSEITSSNSNINNGIWNATLVPFGSYQFKYTVSGFCAAADEAIITVNLNEKPILNVLPNTYNLCSGENLIVDAGLTNSNFNYQWTGPNGFSSNDEILQINSIQDNSEGTYSLLISNNGCDSDAYNFIVNVNTLPDFYIAETCVNNIKTLTAIPINGSFNLSEIQFVWTGPDGFTSSVNPIQLQGETVGNYNLTIQNASCEVSREFLVESLACSIPSGVSSNGDGLNDFFDLSGFDVVNLKIFNRYGREVYSEEDYEREWYGQDFNGHMLPAATYYYYVKLADGVEKTGWVYLTRD